MTEYRRLPATTEGVSAYIYAIGRMEGCDTSQVEDHFTLFRNALQIAGFGQEYVDLTRRSIVSKYTVLDEGVLARQLRLVVECPAESLIDKLVGVIIQEWKILTDSDDKPFVHVKRLSSSLDDSFFEADWAGIIA